MTVLYASLSQMISDPFFNPTLSVLTILLLTLTTVAGFWSSIANAKANELKLLPLPVVYFTVKMFKDRKIMIKNLGAGVAYDIKIEDFFDILIDIQKIWILKMSLTGSNYLEIGIEKELQTTLIENSKEISDRDFVLFHLDPDEKHERKPVRLSITFKNAYGTKYFCRVETGKDGLKILTPAKKIGILEYIKLKYIALETITVVYFYKLVVWKIRRPYITNPKNPSNN